MEWTHEKETLVSPGGIPYEERHTASIHGELVIDGGQRAIANVTAVFERALKIPGQDLVLHLDDGSIGLALVAATSTTGTNVRSFRYPVGGGGFEFVSGRTFDFTVTAAYPLVIGAGVLLAYQERVSTEGDGGPVAGVMLPVNAPPIIQTLHAYSPVYITQSGFAEGLAAYPTPPPPLFRLPWAAPPQVGRDSARADGLSRRGFRVDWTYRFLAARYTTALPHQWPRGQ